MDPDPATYVLLFFVLSALAFFSSFAFWSLYAAGDSELAQLSEEENPKARRALTLRASMPAFFEQYTAVLLLCFGAEMVLCTTVPLPIAGMSPFVFAAELMGLCFLLFLLLGVLIPKSLGLHKKSAAALRLLWMADLIRWISWPVLLLPRGVRYLLLRPFGLQKKPEHSDVTEEKIMMLLDEGEQAGAIQDNERDMIEGVFELDDTDAGAIMTHRTDLVALEDTDSLEKAVELVRSEGYSRMPVYHEDIDDIVGVLYAKDLLIKAQEPQRASMKVADLMRPILYVPETINCRDLFAAFRERRTQIAVVVDEYGGTSGIITMEDILETIVGSIQDEYDDEEAEVTRHGEDTLSIDGTMPLDDVEELLGIQLPEQTDYDTLSGLMMDLLDRIPGENEHPSVMVQGWMLRVQKVEDRRIVRVLAQRLPKQPLSEEMPEPVRQPERVS